MDNYETDQAALYYKAQVEGMILVKDIIQEHNIQCDFAETYACVYAKDEKDTIALDIKEKGPYTVETRNGHQITANSVIIATGYPFFDANAMYFSRL